MKLRATVSILAVLTTAGIAFSQEKEASSRLTPVFDTPLRDTSVCRGDVAWYLTGTVSSDESDFQNNDGVWLWKSADCKTWKPMGQVWSIERDAAQDSWQRMRRVVNDPALGAVRENGLARGMVSPEIHCLKNNYFVNERELHNLIWVCNAAHVSHGLKKRGATFEDQVVAGRIRSVSIR